MNVIALLTRFRHHSPTGGYKRLLSELMELGVAFQEFGNDETRTDFPRNAWERQQASYKWLAEWRAFSQAKTADLVHIMYGEEYFRFSHWLFPRTPLVATFHQPASLLASELRTGRHGGRIAGLTHRLTQNRFKKLAAAIVTNPDQAKVLEEVMPANRIHVIPLGVDLPELTPLNAPRTGVITLGNWLRDWETYERVARLKPEIRFTLINRNLAPEWKTRFAALPNVSYLSDLSEAELQQELGQADIAFLPLKQLAGSNALLECLALGLPIALSDTSADAWRGSGAVELFAAGDADAASKVIDDLLEKSFGLREKAREIAEQFSWASIAKQTHEIYKSIV
jgi:glycosyltransferase involved in cell wall biosynthesis